MDFENAVVDLHSLPKAEAVELQHIHPDYGKVLIIHQCTFWGITAAVLFAVFFFIEELQTRTAIGIGTATYALLLLVTVRLQYLSFRNKAFAIRTHDVIYQSGWLIKTLHVCPFNRVQHCSVDSGIFERRYGLTRLKIYSAGGDHSDISIPGLTIAQSDTLRALIVDKINA